MFHFLRRRDNEAWPQKDKTVPKLAKPFSSMLVPMLYIRNQYNEYKKLQKVNREKSTTEKELKKLNNKIVSET